MGTHASIWMFFALLAFACAGEKKIICYWGSWSVYRTGAGNFNTTQINASLCTHLIYAFAGIDGATSKVQVLDPWADLPDGGGKNGYNLFNALRSQNKDLQTIVGVGGWNQGSAKYSKMAASPELRKAFIDSAVDLVKNYSFNGMDLDWEYPAQRDGDADADKQNFVLLVKEMSERFKKEGLLLSAAVAAAESSASKSYNISEISKYLDFINLMAYDYHVAAENKTGLNTPLHPGSWEKGEDRKLNINASVRYWLTQGAPKEKIMLGTAFYGRTFTLADAKNSGIGAPVTGPGSPGPFTQEAGTQGYNEICLLTKSDKWTVHYDEEQRTPYMVNGAEWIAYDDAKSLAEKAKFINDAGLGGAMVWSLESDDFLGSCGRKNVLLHALNCGLRKKH